MTFQAALDRLSQSAADSAAWGVLFRTLWPYVFGLARSYLSNPGRLMDAEDVAQEVFFALARALHQGRLRLPLTEEALRPLLLVMARNRALDHVRQEHRQQRDVRRRVPLHEAREAPSPQQSVEARLEQQELLERFLDWLDPFDRQVVRLVLEGYEPAEIARRLDTTAKTVRRHQRWLASLLHETQALDSS